VSEEKLASNGRCGQVLSDESRSVLVLFPDSIDFDGAQRSIRVQFLLLLVEAFPTLGHTGWYGIIH
jgi:hypothetical protein